MNLLLNGELRPVATEATLSDLLASLQLAGKLVLIERNGRPVQRGDFALTKLADGDIVEIVRLSAGG
jgi:sulfur carrier protein